MSEMTMEAVVIDVELRKGTSKKTNEPYTCYDIIDADNNKWVAWDKDLAEQAWKLKNQVAIWKVDITKNGNYTNRTLRAIEAKPVSGFEPALNAMAAQIGGISSATFSPTVGEPAAPMFTKEMVAEQIAGPIKFSESGTNPTYTDRAIWRQTATKVASTLGGTADEFWSNVFELVEFYETGVRPGSLDQLISSGKVTVGVPQESSWQPDPPGVDDDIPF